MDEYRYIAKLLGRSVNEDEVFEASPSIEDVNRLFSAINEWLSHFGYKLLNTTRGPQVGETGLATMQKYQKGNLFLRVFVDIIDGWDWKILMIVSRDGAEIARQKKNVKNLVLEQVAKEVNTMLHSLLDSIAKPVTFNESFYVNLFKSTLYLADSKYFSAIKR